MNSLYFLIEKTKLISRLVGQINERQEKVLLRLFKEGFKGGLSAENYISITKTSRATATRDLSDLVEKGALLKTGELRHTRYWLPIHLKQEKGALLKTGELRHTRYWLPIHLKQENETNQYI